MNKDELTKNLDNAFTLIEQGPDKYKITCDAKFMNGRAIEFNLVNENGKWYLTDGKSVLKFMNEIYELKSDDVKSCISSVIKIYGFTIFAGELRGELTSTILLKETLFKMIMCVAQLTNMFAFFEKPE